MANTSKSMLNRSGESGHPCLVPDFRGNAFNFSPLRVMLAVGLSYIAFFFFWQILYLLTMIGRYFPDLLSPNSKRISK